MKIVIAGNYEQYRNWLRETGNNPQEYRYIYKSEQLQGLELAEDDVIRVGEYWKSEIGPYEVQLRIRK